MTYHRGKLLLLGLGLGLASTACDPAPERGSDPGFRSLRGVGTGTGLTLNTNQWVGSSARDVYEFAIDGSWHSNSFGYDNKFTSVSVPQTPYGPVSTVVGPPPPPGQPRALMVPGDDFTIDVLGPNPAVDPVVHLQGPDLIGLRLGFTAKGFDQAEHPVLLEFIDHLEDEEAGDFYEIVKIDPVTKQPIAHLCEEDANGYRLARIYDGLSVDGKSGVMTFVGDGIHHVACTASAPAKSVLFGYNPMEVSVESFTLVNRVVRADYCADGYPYTYPGNLLGIEDNVSEGQAGKTLADVYAGLGTDEVLEAVWGRHGVLCVDVPRASNLDREDVVCPIRQFTDGTVAYNWQPPSCEGFVDDNPSGDVRFYSKSQL